MFPAYKKTMVAIKPLFQTVKGPHHRGFTPRISWFHYGFHPGADLQPCCPLRGLGGRLAEAAAGEVSGARPGDPETRRGIHGLSVGKLWFTVG